MTEETFTLKEIKDAWERVGEREDWQGDFDIDDVLAELTTPKFAERQVVVFSNGKLRYARELQGGDFHISRPLNQTEVGIKNWVPRAEFDKLQDMLEEIAAESQMKIPASNGWAYTYSEMAQKALDAIPENLK